MSNGKGGVHYTRRGKGNSYNEYGKDYRLEVFRFVAKG